MSDFAFKDISANGTSGWVTLGQDGGVVSVDCVDPVTNESMSWGGATAALLYSPDTRMKTAVSDESGAVSGTDGYSRILPYPGFVAIEVTNYSAGKFRISVNG
jgi:hypothetical protein